MTQDYRDGLLRDLLESCRKPLTEKDIIAATKAAMDLTSMISDKQMKDFVAEIEAVSFDGKAIHYRIKHTTQSIFERRMQ